MRVSPLGRPWTWRPLPFYCEGLSPRQTMDLEAPPLSLRGSLPLADHGLGGPSPLTVRISPLGRPWTWRSLLCQYQGPSSRPTMDLEAPPLSLRGSLPSTDHGIGGPSPITARIYPSPDNGPVGPSLGFPLKRLHPTQDLGYPHTLFFIYFCTLFFVPVRVSGSASYTSTWSLMETVSPDAGYTGWPTLQQIFSKLTQTLARLIPRHMRNGQDVLETS